MMATDNETSLDTDKGGEHDGSMDEDYDNEERLAREKLKKWQARQVDKGLVDNTINKVLENYILPSIGGPIHFVPLESLDSDVQNIAVKMAIRNHGLGQPKLLSRSQPFSDQMRLATTSSTTDELTNFDTETDIEKYDGLDSDQQETFLERAVAEAIKKKGLSALSVD